ncbi:FYDLN acid domain-containing protein [Terasakiella sp.]|uniref:FYDLN acid domain-containing protein n=1 Tax=Terasakiella sp. TaxID=2034861 RepID=UPI003AA90E32
MKPEWGSKHECPGCGAHFYDMRKPDAACPKCSTPINDKAALMAKKGAVEKAPPPKIKRNDHDDLDDFDDVNDDDDLALSDDDDDFIEDTDDLVGNDESDMSEIMEHIDEDTIDENI